MFSSWSFIVSILTFMSLIHFEFIFVFGIRECSDFIFLHVVVQFSQHHLLKRLFFCFCFFTVVFSFLLCHRLDDYMCLSLSLGSLSCSIDVCFSFCASTSVLMTVALQCNLKSGSLIPPALFFFLKIAVTIWDFWCFHTKMPLVV